MSENTCPVCGMIKHSPECCVGPKREPSSLAPATGSAALVLRSLEYGIEFTVPNGELTIHDADNAWKDWYHLSASQTQELLRWLKRVVPPNTKSIGGTSDQMTG